MDVPPNPPYVTRIELSDEERISGNPTVEHMQQALISFHRDGTSFVPIG
jgi:hypothetical protein